ncbi:hypothetical protein KC19_1G149000 [Ceratodon purpureus]|uniref:RING-type domain-containing protein n=1 Tax=Ceratodon purpureus TaxID=3225 RepID=A0A8T0J7A1_CERPU|nr:hypothetical protein KC19_1G149000 [Ceratodon purpureus]
MSITDYEGGASRVAISLPRRDIPAPEYPARREQFLSWPTLHLWRAIFGAQIWRALSEFGFFFILHLHAVACHLRLLCIYSAFTRTARLACHPRSCQPQSWKLFRMSARFYVDGVPEGGIKVGDIGQERVPESMICSFFGPKSSKSGWKYQQRTSPEEQDAILSLYRRVYESQDIPNKEISVQFARGLILWSEGTKVDWEEFRVSRRKYREGIRKKKEQTKLVRSERDGEGVVPSIIGKRRCLASQGILSDEFPRELKLTVKSEVLGEGFSASMGRRGGGKSRNPIVSPCWLQDDINGMVEVIGDRSALLEGFRVSLEQVTKVRGEKEDSLRRARLMQEDRTVMLAECESEISRIDGEELSIRAQMEEKSILLESLGSGDGSLVEKETLVAQLSSDERKCEALCASRIDEQRSGKRSRQIVTECEETIGRLERELEMTYEDHTNLQQKVEAFVRQAAVMEEQLRMMREGVGNTFWPLPIAACPEQPVQTVHTLNPCPVCRLWYSCFDYVPIGCGHCYHPWCLAEHAKVSSRCLLPDCGKAFVRRHQIALGIRTSAQSPVMVVKKEQVQASRSLPAAEEKAKESGVVSSCEEGERNTLGSQASENNVWEASRGCASGEGNVPGTCHVCKSKASAVRLKACGHDTFCFGCVNGMTVCPTCKEKIGGWEATAKVHTIRNVAVKGGATGMMASASTGNNEDLGSKGAPVVAFSGEECADIVESDEESDEDDHRNDGLVHYCDDETFRKGGVRSVSVEHLLKGVEEEVLLTTDEAEQTETVATTSHQLEAPPSTSPNPAREKERSTVVKKKRSEKEQIDDSMNHTRIVKRTMDEILGLVKEDEPPKKKPRRPRSVVKRSGPESSGQGIRVPRNGTGRQTVPAKFRDM